MHHILIVFALLFVFTFEGSGKSGLHNELNLYSIVDYSFTKANSLQYLWEYRQGLGYSLVLEKFFCRFDLDATLSLTELINRKTQRLVTNWYSETTKQYTPVYAPASYSALAWGVALVPCFTKGSLYAGVGPDFEMATGLYNIDSRVLLREIHPTFRMNYQVRVGYGTRVLGGGFFLRARMALEAIGAFFRVNITGLRKQSPEVD